MVYDINLKNARGSMLFGIIFTLAGLLFLVVFGAVSISTVNKKNAMDAQTKAINVTWQTHYDSEDNSTTFSPIYDYVVDGQNYTCGSSSSSSIKSGDGIVYYNSSNPSECITDFEYKTNNFFILFLILPIIFIIIGALDIKKFIKRTKIVKNLATNGVLVRGLPYQIVNSNVSVNNTPLKCILTSYKFPDGTTREIKGEAMRGRVISDADGKCDLLYDPSNYDNFYVDLEIPLTGHGSPNIVNYQADNQNININQANDYMNNSNTVNDPNNYSNDNGYNPGNKY